MSLPVIIAISAYILCMGIAIVNHKKTNMKLLLITLLAALALTSCTVVRSGCQQHQGFGGY